MATGRTEHSDGVRVLSRAVDQAGDVLDHVHHDYLRAATPCADWDLGDLVDHLVASPRQLLALLRGEPVDWAAAPPHLTEEWGPTFRVAGDDLVHAWHQQADDAPVSPDMHTAELALHTWDVARTIGRMRGDLDPEVAERASPSCAPTSPTSPAVRRSGRRSRSPTVPGPTSGWRRTPDGRSARFRGSLRSHLDQRVSGGKPVAAGP